MYKVDFAAKIKEIICDRIDHNKDELQKEIIGYIDNNETSELRQVDLEYFVEESFTNWTDNILGDSFQEISKAINEFLA